jgi:hypothetical protein
MTIVHCDYRPKRSRQAKVAPEFPLGRIVSARPPQKRRYAEFPNGVPDGAGRAKLIDAFMARTEKQRP